jgi:lipoate-protein ligase A
MAESRRPVMRVYQWLPWCISLGYHQSDRCLNQDLCRKEGVDVVRRQTGGRAVFHAEEITYSVILPRDHALSVSVSMTYQYLSQGLANGLRKLGVPASFQRRAVDLKSHYTKKISASCFSAASLHEIVVHGKKLVGSAQRRLPGGVLQHGSILIGSAHLTLFQYFKGLTGDERESLTSEMAGKTATIESVLQSPVSIDRISQALREGMAETFKINFHEKILTSNEIKEIKRRRERFSILENSPE